MAAGKYKRKKALVMKEWQKGELHMGRSKKMVPRHRPDMAYAIANSEARKAVQKKRSKPVKRKV